MANNIIRRVWNQNRMVNIEDLYGAAFQAEIGGHTFEISGIDDTGAAVELSGTVSGVFRRPDNADIALTGSASDGVVSVTLSEDCYAVPGRFGLTIFVTSNSQKVAVYACVGTVAVSSTGNVAGDTPASVEDLIDDINAAIADLNTAIGSIPADYSQFMAAIAPAYSSSALYAVGSYAWYNGSLYRCITAITTAEAWTAAHWTAAVLGDDVGDLKSQIRVITGNEYIQFSDPNLKQYINTNVSVGTTVSWDTPSTSVGTNIKWAVVPCSEGDKFILNGKGGNADRLWAFLDSSKKLISKSNQNATATELLIIAPENAAYLVLNDEQNKNSLIGVPLKDTVKQIQDDVTEIDAYFAPGYNLFNPDDPDVVLNKELLSNGTINDNSGRFISGYIKIEPGKKVCCNFPHVAYGNSSIITFYNASKERVSYSTNVTKETDSRGYTYITYTFTNPFPYEYFRLNGIMDSMDIYMYVYADTMPETYEPYMGNKKTLSGDILVPASSIIDIDQYAFGSQWKGKSWFAYGTSLTNISDEGKYAKYVRDLSGLELTNKGISGGAICNNSLIKNAVMNITDGKLNADLITLEIGANDTTAPLGTIYDTGNDTFCGALNQCIRYLQENTSAQIVVISSTNARKNSGNVSAAPEVTYGTDNHTKYDQWKATEEVCKINSCYYIPMGETANMSWARMNASNLYNVDNIHHTELGGFNLGYFVWYRLASIPLWYSSMPT